MTTRGWSLLVQWKDGSTSWEKLKDLKASNPVEVAEYAVANRLVDEPAFKWWSVFVSASILKASSTECGNLIPNLCVVLQYRDFTLDMIRFRFCTVWGTWRRALNKEMSRVKIAWKARDDVSPTEVRQGKVQDMVGYQEIGCHVVFDVKMTFDRKCRFVAGGHTTEAPASMTYSSVVSRNSMRLGFLLAALNGVDMLACDLENAYLNAPCREKIWFEGGRECGEDQGKVLVVTRALYGLKSAGSSWRSSLAEALRNLKFESTRADPDVWIRPAAREDGHGYYEMLFV